VIELTLPVALILVLIVLTGVIRANMRGTEISYHENNLGMYSGYVGRFADLTGYVPERGDKKSQFN
jgi:hypothetical protein